MAGNPEDQNIDAYSPPSPITPGDSPSSPSNYAAVTPHGRGPAPYDIQAPLQDLSGLTAAAGALAGAGVAYPHGPRQAQAEMLLSGQEEVDVTAGWSGSGSDGWPASPEPPGM